MKRLILMLFFSLIAVSAGADERILDFHSDMTVREDGSMKVIETIKVRSEGMSIKRGIYRTIPTRYRGAFGSYIETPIAIISVARDGEQEPIRVEARGRYLDLYIGNRNRLLKPGEYTYTISYVIERHLGFFDDYDELYWNVSGNKWELPIDRVSAKVHLPEGAVSDDFSAEAYTGPLGSKDQHFQSEINTTGIYFETTQRLAKGEGLSIVVTWPKGVVKHPTPLQRFGWYISDNQDTVVLLMGLFTLVIFYLFMWLAHGRDPKPGVIIPQYDPPAGYSPGAIRYIMNQGIDTKTFSTALVSLATKGYLILVQKESNYSAKRTDKAVSDDLCPAEKALLESLFEDLLSTTVDFDQENQEQIQAAIEANRQALRQHCDKEYFRNNRQFLLPGILITLFTLISFVASKPFIEIGILVLFLSLWMTLFTFALDWFVKNFRPFEVKKNFRSIKDFVALLIFMLTLFFFVVFLIFALIMSTSLINVVALLLLLIIHHVFSKLIKAPTLAGRDFLDKMEGFKLYLTVAEQDEWQLKHPPEKTPELFERLFPYAMALDLEQPWTDRFTMIFANMKRQGQPYKYTGLSSRSLSLPDAALASALASSINQATVIKSTGSRGSSSSSFSSGSSSGSSGGGRGGGGGGGW